MLTGEEFSTGDDTLPFLCAAGPSRCPEGLLSLRLSLHELEPVSNHSQWGRSFYPVRDGISTMPSAAGQLGLVPDRTPGRHECRGE